MACARCDFYVPKESSRAQSIEAKTNLLRLRQDIPLTEDLPRFQYPANTAAQLLSEGPLDCDVGRYLIPGSTKELV